MSEARSVDQIAMVTCYQVCEDQGAVLCVPLGAKYTQPSEAERSLDALRSAHPKAYTVERKRPFNLKRRADRVAREVLLTQLV
jgi:hypothetical protein